MAFIGLINKDGTVARQTGRTPITNYTDYQLPIVYLSGSIAGMSKDNAVTLNYVYGERTGTCTLKWQGSSSIVLPKKNYTVKFDEAFEVVPGWGAQNKYCFKANYVDSSHARNVVCAKLWGQIVKSRTPANTTLNALPNGGAIDGFPIILSINGEYQGIYTWNIPKDAWMFGMDGTGQQAILCAEYYNNGAVGFKGLATLTEDANGQIDFELEFSSDDQKDWVVESINRLISAVMSSDGTNITYGIAQYLDLESAIDYYIHAVLTSNYDGVWRNHLLATYDGIKWFFTGYDMDVVLGLRAMGKYFFAADNAVSFSDVAGMHGVFALIWKYMRPQLRARYNELRAAAMSVNNVANMFVDFTADIPLPVYIDDMRKWNGLPSTSANNIAQIITYYDLRCRNADEWIKSTVGEVAMPEQINPNSYSVMNVLTNCTTSNSASTVEKNAAYTATITANGGYELDSVTVTMGGVDVTSTVYVSGVISIPAVTGDLVITASATAKAEYTYTNQVPLSVDTDGSIFNGKGWLESTRLSSSGVTKAADYVSVTGYIPIKGGDILRIKGAPMLSGGEYVAMYDSNFTLVVAIPGTSLTGTVSTLGTVVKDDILTMVTLINNNDFAWVRVSLDHGAGDPGYATAADPVDGPGSYMIVTVNEEITD